MDFAASMPVRPRHYQGRRKVFQSGGGGGTVAELAKIFGGGGGANLLRGSEATKPEGGGGGGGGGGNGCGRGVGSFFIFRLENVQSGAYLRRKFRLDDTNINQSLVWK